MSKMEKSTKRFALLLVLVLLLDSSNASNLKWVPAEYGYVPPYAVVGGENYSGEGLYVARVKLNTGFFAPGKMAPSFQVAHASYAGRETYYKEYEILTNQGFKSHLEWKKSSGGNPPANAVQGGREQDGTPLYVARFMYVDGHMIPGKVNYGIQRAFLPYNGKEYESREWYVLVEHPARYVRRGTSKRSAFSELPFLKNTLRRTPVSKK